MIYHAVSSRPDENTDSLYGTFTDLPQAVDLLVAKLMGRRDFDAIVVQGTSGMALGFPAYVALRAEGWDGDIMVVRKAGDDAHQWRSDNRVHQMAGDSRGLAGKRCLFVDDFVSEGTTRRRVREAVEERGGRLVAQYTSQEDSYEAL